MKLSRFYLCELIRGLGFDIGVLLAKAIGWPCGPPNLDLGGLCSGASRGIPSTEWSAAAENVPRGAENRERAYQDKHV
jgi:hypothetical protein